MSKNILPISLDLVKRLCERLNEYAYITKKDYQALYKKNKVVIVATRLNTIFSLSRTKEVFNPIEAEIFLMKKCISTIRFALKKQKS